MGKWMDPNELELKLSKIEEARESKNIYKDRLGELDIKGNYETIIYDEIESVDVINLMMSYIKRRLGIEFLLVDTCKANISDDRKRNCFTAARRKMIADGYTFQNNRKGRGRGVYHIVYGPETKVEPKLSNVELVIKEMKKNIGNKYTTLDICKEAGIKGSNNYLCKTGFKAKEVLEKQGYTFLNYPDNVWMIQSDI